MRLTKFFTRNQSLNSSLGAKLLAATILAGFSCNFSLAQTAVRATAPAAQINQASELKTEAQSFQKNTFYRIGLLQSTLALQTETSAQKTQQGKFADSLGFSFEYAYLPLQDLGFIGGLSFSQGRQSGSSFGIIRLEGNFGTQISSKIHLKGGLNLARIVEGTSYLQNLRPILGFQLGAGLRLTQKVMLELSYVDMNLSAANESPTFQESRDSTVGRQSLIGSGLGNFRLDGPQISILALF